MVKVKVAIITIAGLITGSFLNAVIYRIPRGISIITPRSHCPSCETELGIQDLIPLFSYISTGGKCRYCGESIGLQYLLVELLTALSFLLLYQKLGNDLSIFFYIIPVMVMISTTFTDLEKMMVPNKITYPAVILGFFLAIFTAKITIVNSLLGILVPGGVLLLLHAVYPQGLGMGDVKLVAALGAFLGWKVVLLGIFLGSLFGLVAALVLLYLGVIDRRTRIPFAPLINGGCFLAFIFEEPLLLFYLNLF
ncbi:MAG: prepilin peptidase [Bacillota bacterium]